jgi:hypothetical protein
MYTSVPSLPGQANRLTQGLSSAAAADAKLEQRVSFDFLFGLIFLVALHGFSTAKVYLILYANYKLAKGLPRAYVPMATWIFNIGILFANELCRGYPYASIVRFLHLAAGEKGGTQSNWGSWMDSHGGLTPRWEVLFNITILRLISFNMDYYWSLERSGESSIEVRS